MDLGGSYTNLAVAAAHSGNLSEAIRTRQLAEAIFDSLATDSPNDPKILVPRGWNCLRPGELQAKQGDWQGARRTYAVGLQVAERVAPRNPAFTDILAAPYRSDNQAAAMPAEH